MRNRPRALLAVLLSALALLTTAAAALPTPAPAAAPQTTTVDVEDEVMCVTCGVPLNIAESPQAPEQRELIAELVAEGRTKDEVKQALVAEYGERVLAVPGDEGFELTAWVLPSCCWPGESPPWRSSPCAGAARARSRPPRPPRPPRP